MSGKFYLMVVMFIVSMAVIAIDEDYYIPYTDTYGYVYDPETGQFVKSEESQASMDITQEDNISSTSNGNAQHTPDMTNMGTDTLTQTTSSGDFTYLLIAGITFLVLLSAWIWKRRGDVRP